MIYIYIAYFNHYIAPPKVFPHSHMNRKQSYNVFYYTSDCKNNISEKNKNSIL